MSVSLRDIGVYDGKVCSPFIGRFLVLAQFEDVNVAFPERIMNLQRRKVSMQTSAQDTDFRAPLRPLPKGRSVQRLDNKNTLSKD